DSGLASPTPIRLVKKARTRRGQAKSQQRRATEPNSISIPSPSPLSRPPHCRSPPTTSFLIAVTMVRVTRKRTASKISSEIEPSLPPVPSKSTKVQKKSPPAATPTRRTSSRKAAIAQTPKSATPEAPAEETVEEKRVRLRNNWKFAATWQFFFNFSEAF